MDAPSIRTSLVQSLLKSDELEGTVAVVIDVLRASTTVCTALANGATAIVPFRGIDEATAFREARRPSPVLLGGERQGVRIGGFDLDNSPQGYHREVVGSKLIGFTTTNGTQALHRCLDAEEVLIGSFVNIEAVVERLVALVKPVHFVCAGTNGEVSAEDCLCAGAMIELLIRNGVLPEVVDDQSTLAREFAKSCAFADETRLAALSSSYGGRNLTKLGLEEDINIAAGWNTRPVVPRWDAETNRITIES